MKDACTQIADGDTVQTQEYGPSHQVIQPDLYIQSEAVFSMIPYIGGYPSSTATCPLDS